MHLLEKNAADMPFASPMGATSASPIPTPSIEPTPAAGKQGPRGLSPRQNYSRVNTGAPPQADAGASEQKSLPPRGAEMLPKIAGDVSMGKMAGRPLLQNLIKAAMVESADRVRVTNEARLQAEKTAGEECPKCGKEKCSCATKTGSSPMVGQHVEKLAGALDYLATTFEKQADMAGPYHLSEHLVDSPPGVSQATASTPLPDHKGQGVNTVPMHPGMQKDLPAEHGATQMADNIDMKHKEMPPNIVNKSASVVSTIREKLEKEGGVKDVLRQGARDVKDLPKHLKDLPKNIRELPKHEGQAKRVMQELRHHGGSVPSAIREGMSKSHVESLNAARKAREGIHGAARGGAIVAGGTAAAAGGAKAVHSALKKDSGEKKASLADYMLQYVKQAEDAINPAKINAGAAVPPETMEGGQAPKQQPAGGPPRGPSSHVSSSEAAINATKGETHGPRREELKKYFNEPALSSAHDNVLQVAFKNTGKAGPKIASAEAAADAAPSVKTAAARALLGRLAENIKNNESTQAQGA